MSQAIDTVLVAYGSESVIAGAVVEAKKLDGRVVVVDHGDGTSAALAAGVGAVAIADPRNPGFGAGQNRGVLDTVSPYVLLCNPDAAIDATAVRIGGDFLDSHPGVGAVQGVIVNRDTGEAERSQGLALRPVHLVGRAVGARRLLGMPLGRRIARRSATLRDHAERVPSAPMNVESLAATVLLVRRAAFDSVGGFDARYFLYGEDLDLCRRLRQEGWRLTAMPDVWAVHESGGSAGSPQSRDLHWWRGTMEYAAQWWTTADWAIALVAATLQVGRMAARHPRRAPSLARSLLLGPARERRRRR